MPLIDTHAHLYDEVYVSDPQHMDRFLAIEGEHVCLPNIDAHTLPLMVAFHEKYPQHTSMMIGLHPCYVGEDVDVQLQHLEEQIGKYSFCAVGETGLDNITTTPYRKLQYRAFTEQIRWALTRHLPIVIHARNSIDECNDLVAEQKGLQGVFHCFTGDVRQAERIIACGFYLGIGGVVTFKNAGPLHEAVREIPLAHMVLETDAPYLAPVPFRGKMNESAYLVHVAEKIAQLKGTDVADVIEQTTQNAKALFSLP